MVRNLYKFNFTSFTQLVLECSVAGVLIQIPKIMANKLCRPVCKNVNEQLKWKFMFRIIVRDYGDVKLLFSVCIALQSNIFLNSSNGFWLLQRAKECFKLTHRHINFESHWKYTETHIPIQVFSSGILHRIWNATICEPFYINGKRHFWLLSCA